MAIGKGLPTCQVPFAEEEQGLTTLGRRTPREGSSAGGEEGAGDTGYGDGVFTRGLKGSCIPFDPAGESAQRWVCRRV